MIFDFNDTAPITATIKSFRYGVINTGLKEGNKELATKFAMQWL